MSMSKREKKESVPEVSGSSKELNIQADIKLFWPLKYVCHNRGEASFFIARPRPILHGMAHELSTIVRRGVGQLRLATIVLRACMTWRKGSRHTSVMQSRRVSVGVKNSDLLGVDEFAHQSRFLKSCDHKGLDARECISPMRNIVSSDGPRMCPCGPMLRTRMAVFLIFLRGKKLTMAAAILTSIDQSQN